MSRCHADQELLDSCGQIQWTTSSMRCTMVSCGKMYFALHIQQTAKRVLFEMQKCCLRSQCLCNKNMFGFMVRGMFIGKK